MYNSSVMKIVYRMKFSTYSNPSETMATAVRTSSTLYVPGTSLRQLLKNLWELPCFCTSTSHVTK
jgi:hypothetical protein